MAAKTTLLMFAMLTSQALIAGTHVDDLFKGTSDGPRAPKNPMSLEKIDELLKNPDVQSVEDLLAKLPEELMNNCVAVTDSKSPEGASPEKTRVLVYSNDGRFTLAFNDQSMPGGNQVQIMEAKDNPPRFEFHSRTIAPNKGHSNESGDCARCHGRSSLRPNWESYPCWPGVCYSFESPKAKDVEACQQWEKKKPQHSRYKYLKKECDHASNIRFSTLLQLHNLRRVAHIMKSWRGYEVYKLAILASASEGMCPFTPETFLPEKVRRFHDQYARDLGIKPGTSVGANLRYLLEPYGIDVRNFSMHHRTVRRSDVTDAKISSGCIEDGNGSFNSGSDTGSRNLFVATLRDADSSLPNPSHITGGISCKDLAAESRKAFEGKALSEGRICNCDDDFAEAPSAFGQIISLVFELKGAKSQAPQDPEPPKSLQTCIRCHVGKEDPSAPRIPFHDPNLLRKALRERDEMRGTLADEIRSRLHEPNKKRRMPPYDEALEGGPAAIEKYIDRLSGTNGRLGPPD